MIINNTVQLVIELRLTLRETHKHTHIHGHKGGWFNEKQLLPDNTIIGYKLYNK